MPNAGMLFPVEFTAGWIATIVVAIVLAVIALARLALQRDSLKLVTAALWVLVIVALPYVGPIASFLLLRPTNHRAAAGVSQ